MKISNKQKQAQKPQKNQSMHKKIPKISLLIYYVDRICEKLRIPFRVSDYAIVAQPVPPSRILPRGRGKSIEVRRLSKTEPCLQDLPLSEDTLRRRREREDILCFGAFKGEQLVGCNWLSLGDHDDELLDVRFAPRPDEGRATWDFDLYIVPQERLGFAFARIWDDIFDFMREAGFGWSVSYISPINQTSWSAHKRLGSFRIASLVLMKAGPVQVMLSTVRPFFAAKAGTSRNFELRCPVPPSGKA